MGEVRARSQELLLNREAPAPIEEDHPFHSHRQQRQRWMGAEAAFAGDGQPGTTGLKGQLRLGDAGLQSRALAQHRAAEAAQSVGVDAA